MRIVIQNADFSAVSIGKVYKDLSFEINSSNLNEMLLNPPLVEVTAEGIDANDSHNEETTIYTGGMTAESFTTENNANRFVSKLMPVIEGMRLTTITSVGPDSTAWVVPFDSNKDLLTPAKGYFSTSPGDYVVPSGVAYIKVQTSILKSTTVVKFEMPL